MSLDFTRDQGQPLFGGENAMEQEAGPPVVGHRLGIVAFSRP
jgi:hypothetical protein